MLWQDLRYGFRMLRKSPGFTAVAVISLALGIGANTAVFSLVNTVLLHPLPVSQPKRLIDISLALKNSAFGNFSYPLYVDIRDKNDVMEGMAGYRFDPMSLSREGHNERIWGYLVSGNYFDVLGVRAFRGRMFTQEEDRVPGANPVAVVSYDSWQRRFGGDPNLVGKTIKINNYSFNIVGIAPEGFTGTVLIFTPEIWVPVMMARQIEPGSNWLEQRNSRAFFAFGRLKRGVTEAQAGTSLSALAVQLAHEHSLAEGVQINLVPPGLVLPMVRNETLNFAWVLMATMVLVLLIACTNLANLLLARATGRHKEFAVRVSIGANRARLVRQSLTESMLLAFAGGIVGWLLALWIVDLVAALKPPVDFALAVDLKVDWRVLMFTLSLSLITGVLFGLAPALQATRQDLVPALKDGASSAGYRRSRLRSLLVIAQVAFSLVLLVAAGLLVRNLQHVQMIGPGFEIERTITMSVDLGLQGYDGARGHEFYKRLIPRVEALPGVRSASLSSYLPLNLDRSSGDIYVEGHPFTRRSELPEVQYAQVWPKYFETMGIPLLQGREFSVQDDRNESRVVIVNQTFARPFWPGQDPIGKRLSQGGPDRPMWEVVGVAKDAKYWSLGEDPQPFVYFPLVRYYNASASLLVCATAEPRGLINAIRREVQQLDANLPVYDVKTMREHMRLSLFPLRTGAWIAGSFASLALILASLGI